MPELIAPDVRVHASFLAAMAELAAEGRGGASDDTMIGSEIRSYGPSWADRQIFARFVAELRAQTEEDAPRPAGYVPCTTLWWVDGADYLGRIAVRHRLTEHLLQVGGHIGYDVRPSARRRGHATAMLRSALPVCAQLGIARALVTCDVGNVASRKVIEANGATLEDERAGKLRYWIDIGAQSGPPFTNGSHH
jgi:predicted acetyltransferase